VWLIESPIERASRVEVFGGIGSKVWMQNLGFEMVPRITCFCARPYITGVMEARLHVREDLRHRA